jgi:hypothetical protein
MQRSGGVVGFCRDPRRVFDRQLCGAGIGETYDSSGSLAPSQLPNSTGRIQSQLARQIADSTPV